MKKFKLLSLLLIITLFVGALPIHALALDAPALTASGVVVMDADTGDILYEKNADQSINPGRFSTMMTALLVAEAIDRQDIHLDDQVTASETFRNYLTADSATADPAIVPGETLTVRDLLYMTVLRSYEDASCILAERTSGSVDMFVEAMNRRAAELGCTDTHFSNPTGVKADGQHTTAADLARIGCVYWDNTTILTISTATSYNVPSTAASGVRSVTSPIQLIKDNHENFYQYAYAGKASGRSSVTAATYNEMDIISVVYNTAEDANTYAEAASLFSWVFSNYDYRLILSATEELETVPVELGSPNSVGVRAANSVSLILPVDQQLGDVQYKIVYDHERDGTPLQAPINTGESLGTVTVYMDGVEYGSSRLVASTSSDISRLEYLRSQMEILLQTQAVQQIFKILLIVMGIYILLVLFYLFQRVRHLISLRRARKDRAIARSQQDIQWLEFPEEDRPVYLPPDEKTFDDPFRQDAPPAEEYYGDGGDYYEEPPAEDGYEEAPVEEAHDEAPADEFYEEPEPAPEEDYFTQEEPVLEEPEEELPPPKPRRSRKKTAEEKRPVEEKRPAEEDTWINPFLDDTPSRTEQELDDFFNSLFNDLN